MRRKRVKLSVREDSVKNTSEQSNRKHKEKPNISGFFDAVCEISSGSSKKYKKKYDFLDGGTF